MAEQIDIIRLILAMIAGYGLLFFLMWLFRRKDIEKSTKKEKIVKLN